MCHGEPTCNQGVKVKGGEKWRLDGPICHTAIFYSYTSRSRDNKRLALNFHFPIYTESQIRSGVNLGLTNWLLAEHREKLHCVIFISVSGVQLYCQIAFVNTITHPRISLSLFGFFFSHSNKKQFAFCDSARHISNQIY